MVLFIVLLPTKAHGFQRRLIPLYVIVYFVLAHFLCVILTFSFGFGLELTGVWTTLIVVRALIIGILFIWYMIIDWKNHTEDIYNKLKQKQIDELR